jgi:hypothetical protein
MTSYKTIKLIDNGKITFTFFTDNILIEIFTINLYLNLTRSHNDFNITLNELKNDFNLTNHKLKLIRYWHYKNYKITYPNQEYITKSGRIVKQKTSDQLHQ